MAKYSLDLKLQIVSEYLEGKMSLEKLGEKYGIHHSQVRTWINNYKTFGIEGLKRSRKNKSYSVEFKLEVLTHYESSEMSYQEIANKFGITNPSMISNWRKSYQNYGLDGLSTKQGRPKKMNKDKKVKKIDDQKV